jgi:RNA polymerase sigma factor (sigma-70 family)
MRNGPLPALLEHLRQWATPETSGLCDAQLLARFRTEPDRDVFAALIQRHGHMVWRVCRNVLRQEQDAEDAFQATFLVLAQNAASIRDTSALAGWLHGTACRIARRARRDAATRRIHEHKRGSMPPTQAREESAWREILALVDDEVQNLALRQRAVFILCSLEGKSLAEAATLLGWKVGTVSVTLSRARQQLRRRLTRRGVELSAVLAGLALATESAPAALVERTLHTALALAAGKRAAELVSASVASLVRQASQTFVETKLRLVVFLLAASLVAAGVAGFAWHKPADNPETAAGSLPRRADAVKSERLDRFGDPLPPGAVARIGSVRWWFGSSHGPLVYTPDGKRLVFRDHRGVVHVMDATTGKELRRLDIPGDGHQSCFALAPNGQTLATGNSRGSEIRLWDLRTGKQ